MKKLKSIFRDHEMSSLKYALTAVRRELFEFRFNYPLDIVLEAGPKQSLHYYLYSDKLTWSVMSMDASGIPRVRGRVYGEVYKPAYIAWWGLVNLGSYLLHNDAKGRDIFLRQVEWLENHVATGVNNAAVWPNSFDNIEGNTLLLAPWVSAYEQGMVISALVRGYRITKRPRLMELLRRSYKVFEVGVDSGGIRQPVSGGGVVYAELPGTAAPGILDGFLTSLLGLYDLMVETGDLKVKTLFDEGLRGLKSQIEIWDYRRKWTWYASRAYLCPASYHVLNWRLITVIARLVNDPILSSKIADWNPDGLSPADKMEIYLGHLITKNACRFRYRTWRQTKARVRLMVAEARQRSLQTVNPDPDFGITEMPLEGPSLVERG